MFTFKLKNKEEKKSQSCHLLLNAARRLSFLKMFLLFPVCDQLTNEFRKTQQFIFISIYLIVMVIFAWTTNNWNVFPPLCVFPIPFRGIVNLASIFDFYFFPKYSHIITNKPINCTIIHLKSPKTYGVCFWTYTICTM